MHDVMFKTRTRSIPNDGQTWERFDDVSLRLAAVYSCHRRTDGQLATVLNVAVFTTVLSRNGPRSITLIGCGSLNLVASLALGS